jgi:hypothetical protein
MATCSRPRPDEVLRKYGFEVVGRPAVGPARWKRKHGAVVYDQPAALAIVARVRKAQAAAGVVA